MIAAFAFVTYNWIWRIEGIDRGRPFLIQALCYMGEPREYLVYSEADCKEESVFMESSFFCNT